MLVNFSRFMCSCSNLYNSGMFVNTLTLAVYFGILNNLFGIKIHLLPPPEEEKSEWVADSWWVILLWVGK